MTVSSRSWHAPLAAAYARFPGNCFQLTTVDPASQTPQCRTVACVGLLSVSPAPDSDSAPLLLASTHVETPKVTEILANPRVQILWYFEGTREQFRISGTASVVASPDRPDYSIYQSQSTMSTLPPKVDFEAKRIAAFKARPAFMSGYARPAWGTPLRDAPPSEEWPKVSVPTEASTDGERGHYETAIRNFALIVVDPISVDYRNATERILFRKTEEGGWEETELVP